MRERRKRNTERYAERLRNNLPASEVWFWTEWIKAGMRLEDVSDNVVFGRYIPDVVNHTFRYVIEVDGSIHHKDEVKRKDAKKEKVFANKGYEVFRIKAYSYDQFGMLVDMVEKHREKYLRMPRVIRRSPINNCLVASTNE
jgi:very-short-patch-repair endonuclease